LILRQCGALNSLTQKENLTTARPVRHVETRHWAASARTDLVVAIPFRPCGNPLLTIDSHLIPCNPISARPHRVQGTAAWRRPCRGPGSERLPRSIPFTSRCRIRVGGGSEAGSGLDVMRVRRCEGGRLGSVAGQKAEFGRDVSLPKLVGEAVPLAQRASSAASRLRH